MIYMHCQVQFNDYATWKASMDADAEAQRNAGLRLKYLWRRIDNPNMAFFVLEVEDANRAKEFLNPHSVEQAENAAGAYGFQWHLVEKITDCQG